MYALKGDSLGLIYEPENNEKLLHLIKDEENNLWLVNSDGAFLKANLRIQKFDLNIAGIRAIEYWNGKLYLGLEYGLYRYEKGKLQMLNSYNVTSLCHNDDYLFVGTFSDGIQILDSQERQLQNIDGWMGIENESILYLYCNSSQQLYASSLTGVVRIDLSGAMENMTIESLNDILGPNYIYSIHHNSGRYYFGTDGRGLIEWDPVSGEVNHRMTFNNDSKLGSVYSMASDETNRVWLTSSELGLLCLDDGELTRLDLKHSLTDEYTSIHSLSDGKIILIRAKSIDVLEPSLGHIMYYDTEVGLSEEVAFLNCTTRHDAFSYFVHDQSIYAYNPSDFQKIHPEIIIDDVLVNFSPLNWRQDLSQNENNLEFRYSASWLTDPLKLSYQYKLEGLDSDWKFTGDRSVSYSKLNPGKYVFKVRASENRAFHDEPEAEFSFEIKRFLYNTLWFRMLSVLFVLLLFWQWRNYIDRQKQLRLAVDKQNVESQLISLRNQLNPHFLFNSFNTLLGLIEEGDTVKSSSFVENLSDFYRMILDYGKNELSTFENEYELAQLYVSLLNERFDGAIQLKHDDDVPSDILMPTLSLQLLIENAIKHNEFNAQNPLRINIEFSESSLSVINNKSPKKYEVKSTGSGLSNIKKRYLLLFGKGIEVINNDSYFKVLLPVEQGRS